MVRRWLLFYCNGWLVLPFIVVLFVPFFLSSLESSPLPWRLERTSPSGSYDPSGSHSFQATETVTSDWKVRVMAWAVLSVGEGITPHCTMAALVASPPLGHQLAKPLGTPAVSAKEAHLLTDYQQKLPDTKQPSSSARASARITTERRPPQQIPGVRTLSTFRWLRLFPLQFQMLGWRR